MAKTKLEVQNQTTEAEKVLHAKLRAFADKWRDDMIAESMRRDGNETWLKTEEERKAWAESISRTDVVLGPKYSKVDHLSLSRSKSEHYDEVLQRMGRYMVVNATGEIFGIKGYGRIHRGHFYGTLETIHEWDWAPYYATKKVLTLKGPKEFRRDVAKHQADLRGGRS